MFQVYFSIYGLTSVKPVGKRDYKIWRKGQWLLCFPSEVRTIEKQLGVR